MKYLIILSSLIFLCSCKSKYSQPLKTVIEEYFKEEQYLNQTSFTFNKRKKVFDLKHNYKIDSVTNHLGQKVPDFDLYFDHDYLYSFKKDSTKHYNIAKIESHWFIIHQVENDSITETMCFEYNHDTIPFTRMNCLGK